jgi:hypothetical protein
MNTSKTNYRTEWKNSDTLTQPGRWLERLGLTELVAAMMVYSEDYKMAWGQSWMEHLNDPAWLSRAMANTFAQLTAADKDKIRPMVEDWQWYEKNFDMKYLMCPEYNALCYLLDGQGKRILGMDGAVTVLRGLKGQDKREAMQTLDRQRYEFKCWW